jgi:glucose-6-phosphate 1-dehydrogenase
VVRGQYTTGKIDGYRVPGYREEEGVALDSDVETYVAMKLAIDNWRWAGVPIYLRTGKRMAARATEIELAFKTAPTLCFEDSGVQLTTGNHLAFRIQPAAQVVFTFGAKTPGPAFEVRPATMDFSFEDSFGEESPEAYERVFYDAMIGDQTLFVREDSVERAWEVLEPVLRRPSPVYAYAAGSWGPPEADVLVAPNQWHLH